jgi:signal transduction histidine kinase
MHDDLGSRLTRIARLGTLTMRNSQSFEEMKSQLGSLTDQVRGLINAMDEVVWTVRPENDSLPSLAAFLSDYTERFLAQTGVSHRLELDPEFPALPVAAEVRHNLLLAAKEVLNNAVRHAAPKIIRLKIHAQDGWLEVVVSDDGHGFDVQHARARGHGLANVAERMTLIKGSAKFASESGKGTTVTLLMPLAGLPAQD